MRTRWIALVALIVAIGGLIAAAVAWDGPNDWGDRPHEVRVVQVTDDDGNIADTGTTFVIERDRGFFPFGIFIIPLGILFVVLIARAIFGRPGGCGPGRGGPPQEWLDDWHRRQHETPGSSGTTA